MTFRSLSKKRRFKVSKYRRTEADILALKNQPASSGDLPKAEAKLDRMRRNSGCPILIREDAESKVYYLLDLDLLATILVDDSSITPYKNAIDLANVSSFETLTNRQIAEDINVVFGIIDRWHNPKTWKELQSMIERHYQDLKEN